MPLKEITISKINHTDKVSKAGKPYISCGIMVTSPEMVEYWINGFGNDITKSFAVGQKVELDVYKDDYGLKFKVPEGMQAPNMDSEVSSLKFRLTRIEMHLGLTTQPEPVKPATEQIDTSGEALAKKLGGTLVEGDPGFVDVSKIPF